MTPRRIVASDTIKNLTLESARTRSARFPANQESGDVHLRMGWQTSGYERWDRIRKKWKNLREKAHKALFEKNAMQRRVTRALFEPFQCLGVHVTADHFYDVVPNTRRIKKGYSNKARDCFGIDFRFSESEKRFVKQLERYFTELVDGEIFACGFENNNWYFSDVDAVALYTSVREMQPATILEIGQGQSTKVIAAASKKNWRESGHTTKLITIDPLARLRIADLYVQGVNAEIVREEAQSVDRSLFEALEPGDLLFVDSSHVHKFGSDVEYQFSQIYPKIRPGVVIHIHDIFSPYEYPERWLVKRKQFWNEQYHLEQFLRFNDYFEVILPVHLLTRASPMLLTFMKNRMSEIGISLTGQSFYMKRTM